MASSAPQRGLSYQPLSAASNEIRILSIKPAKTPQDEIKCQLEHVPLSASSNYVALSYCWGGSDKTVPVRVNNQITHVTPSLASALTEIRSRGHVKVWADAICINQDDDEERSHQVLRMAAIYRSAHAVIAWLGHAEPPAVQGVIHLMGAVETLLGFNDRRDKLQRLGGGSGHDILSEAKLQDSKTPDGQKLRQRALRRVVRGVVKLLDKSTSQDLHPVRKTRGALKHIRANLQDSHWEALERLLSCEYWSRVWVIQELSMANRLQVIWGSHKFAFLDLAYLAAAYKRMRKADMVGDVVSPRACRHIQNLLKFKNLQSGLKAVPLIKALKMTSFARSTDARDKVYGLMGLTYDGSIIFPTPSYGSDIRRVNEDATLRVIRLERSLDTIVFRSKSPRSWLVDWFDSETWLDPRVVSYLDGTMEFRSRNGTLCSKWDAAPSSLPVATVQGQHLVVQGSILDTVGNCSATFEERRSKSKQLPDYGGRRNIRLVKEKSHTSIEFALFNCFCILPDDETRDLSKPGFLMGMQFVSDTIISKRKGCVFTLQARPRVMSDPVDKSLLDRLQALRGGSATPDRTPPTKINVDPIERKKTPNREEALALRLKSLRDQDSPSPVAARPPPQADKSSTTASASPVPVRAAPKESPPAPDDGDIDDAIFQTDDQTLEELLGDVGPDDQFQAEPDDERVKALLEELARAIPKDTEGGMKEDGKNERDLDSDDSDNEDMKRDVDDVLARFRDELELENALAKDDPPDEDRSQDGHESSTVLPSTESGFSLPDLPPTLEDLPAARTARAASTDLDDLTARMAALRAPNASDDMLNLPDVPTDAPSKPFKRLVTRTNYTDDDMDSWCTVCLEDATLRCLGCDDDVYCARCWREMHVGPQAGFDERSHRAVQFTRDKKTEKRKIALGA
ncbi:heterokaryon incompatibility protein-domain-containing protein [Ilyonectria sp. MPI-CAGE-AT-0026]|nr:heterokaryon incompatibility protein-domain-containing protein [Ilyonectria sp. MPI-CAGE-AT-0026]